MAFNYYRHVNHLTIYYFTWIDREKIQLFNGILVFILFNIVASTGATEEPKAQVTGNVLFPCRLSATS